MGNFCARFCTEQDWRAWLWAGFAAFVISLFLPSLGGMAGTTFGWEALYISMISLSGGLPPDAMSLWFVSAAFANITLAVLPLLLIYKPTFSGTSALLAAIFCVAVTASFFIDGPKDLLLGYYVWVTSALFTLLGTICAAHAKSD